MSRFASRARRHSDVSSLQASREERKKYGIPEVVSSGNFRLADTDLFERTWIFWFDGGENGLMEIRVYAPNGLSFVPFFNSQEELEIVSVDYLLSGEPDRDTTRLLNKQDNRIDLFPLITL